MMRLVIGRLLSLIERYPPLVDGAFVIIAWVGLKLLIEFLHKAGYIHLEIPNWISLGLIVVIFVASFLYARTQRAEGVGLGARRRGETPVRGAINLLVSSLETPDRATLAFVRRLRRRHLRAVDAFHPPHLDLFGRRRRCEIFVEQPRLGLRDVLRRRSPCTTTRCLRPNGRPIRSSSPGRSRRFGFAA